MSRAAARTADTAAAGYLVGPQPDGRWFVFGPDGETVRGGFSTRELAWSWVRSLRFGAWVA